MKFWGQFGEEQQRKEEGCWAEVMRRMTSEEEGGRQELTGWGRYRAERGSFRAGEGRGLMFFFFHFGARD